MKPSSIVHAILTLTVCAASSAPQVVAQELKGPMTQTQGTTALPDKDKAEQNMAGLSAPGADAVMNQDMLLINPVSGSASAPVQPLTAFIGMTIKLDVNRKEIKFEDLHGLVITVSNDTNRPLVLDGDNVTAKLADHAYKSASLTALQLAVNPEHGIGRVPLDLITKVAPAAATIGAYPTVADIYKYAAKPTIERYGTDEERREAEASRFGRRILWPHEKTQGIVYFQTKDSLDNSKIEMPVTTLFDRKDTGTLISSP